MVARPRHRGGARRPNSRQALRIPRLGAPLGRPDRADRQHHRPRRPERRGQVHPHQSLGGLRAADGGVGCRPRIDPWRDRRAAVVQTGYIPQTPSLYRELSADDHLALAQTLRRSFDRATARRRLQQLGIPLDSRPGELSGGQQAQLGLAIALGTRAPVLLLDEPLASLDPLARREFLAVLTEAVREDGSTVVLSSHIITDVEAACDRVVVLGGGRKLLDATVTEAVASHVIVPSREGLAPERFVAAFEGPAGERLVLARRDDMAQAAGERAATLEEVVIGFLAARRLPDVAA